MISDQKQGCLETWVRCSEMCETCESSEPWKISWFRIQVKLLKLVNLVNHMKQMNLVQRVSVMNLAKMCKLSETDEN